MHPSGSSKADRDLLLEEARRVAETLPSPEPAFEYEIGWAPGYGEMLASAWDATTNDLHEVLEALHDSGRMILHAEAGAGKSTIAARLFRTAIDAETPALWLDLRRWTPMM